MLKKNSTILLVIVILLFVICVLPAKAILIGDTTKATFSISPQTGKFNAGDTFKVNIYINTNGQAINTVAALLSYDKNHFQAQNIDMNGSAFDIVAETKIDQNNGKITIVAAKLNPGVNISNGLVAGITFKATANTTPAADNLVFIITNNLDTSSSVLGALEGVNYLSGTYGGSYQVGEGGPVTYSDGILLMLNGGTRVYVIDGGQRRWIPTAEIFNSNGYKWANVIEVTQSVLDSISIGPDMRGPVTIPEGGLIRAVGDIDVYIVKYVGSKQFKRLILSPSVFNSYGHLHWNDIKDVEQSVVDSFATSNLVRAVNDPKVYELFPAGDTGQKQWVVTQDVFTRLGLDWDSVYEINAVDRDSYVTGAAIE